jgi:murein DD-endopeptidase MepM/ murein hydrolase activator NlpD
MFHLSGRWLVQPPVQNCQGSAVHAAAVDVPARVTTVMAQGAQAMDTGSLQAAFAQAEQAGPAPASTLHVAASVANATSSATPATAASVNLASLPPSTVSGLLIPVAGVKPGGLADTFTQARSEGRVHDAIDIMAARGTPVVAANDGHVVKLFTSKRGGLTVYEFDPQDKVIYYYAHLDSYTPGLAEGQILHRGDPIGLVGSTGDASADAPHLHFEIEVLGPEKQWWHATSINPYGRFAGQ